MAVTYAVVKTLSTFTVRFRASGPVAGTYTYNEDRAFLSFDLPAAGVTGGVIAADLILRCTTIVGGGCTVRAYTALDPDGWGTTLDATHDDWASTRTNNEYEQAVNATGVYTWPINPAHLSLSARTYFSLYCVESAGAPYQVAASFNSQNAGTPSNRPILRLTLSTGQIIFLQEA